MKAAEFKVQGGLRADLEDFLFEGVRYEVVSYRIGIDAKVRTMQKLMPTRLTIHKWCNAGYSFM